MQVWKRGLGQLAFLPPTRTRTFTNATMATQSPEAKAFIARVAALPSGPVSLDDVLKPSLEDEATLRRLWATDKSNPRLSNPYVGLVDVFAAPSSIRTTRARVILPSEPANAKYICPLPDADRRNEADQCMVDSLDEFKKNWAVFTEGSLSQLLDWNNVVASGGSVLACLGPLPEEVKRSRSKRAVRKWYHTTKYPASDVDLFLWGLNTEQAEKKIIQIYEAVRDSVPWDVTCVRTKHTVSIHSQYPYRSIQIVLRLYTSPAEILAGFDVDAPCCAYDGTRVLASPRSIVAQMRQCNSIDVTRRSPSYEVRLAKYASRGFEVYVPSLEREMVDPTIYERSIARMHGLARLLVLEKLQSQESRDAFLLSRRTLRGRPNPLLRYRSAKKLRKYKGDLKSQLFDLEMNDYDVASLHIPYGPGWDAGRVDRLVYRTDLGMNSGFNPKNKNRRLHRHPAFFGTVEECLEDCCEHCPEPTNEEEKVLQEEEDKLFIRGRIMFMQENPGRQSITGSFNPIDEGEWSEQVYVKPGHKLFAAIARGDLEEVKAILDSAVPSSTISQAPASSSPLQAPSTSPLPQPQHNLLDTRDHVGRTPLHLAIISRAEDVAQELIARGARITPRLVDGKTALHLAAERGLCGVVRRLLERSQFNKEGSAVEEKEEKGGEERASSEDDWSSEEEEEVEKKVPTKVDDGNTGDIPELEDSPDVLDVNLPDWDFGFTPLAYAILFADLETVDILLDAGADVSLPMKNGNSAPFHHLSLTLLRSEEDEEEMGKIIERLVRAGASCAIADEQLKTIFHQAVRVGNVHAVKKFLQCDSSARKALNCPMLDYHDVCFPVVSAIMNGDYAMYAVLLQAGAKMVFKEEDLTSAVHALEPNQRSRLGYGSSSYKNPMDAAMSATEACLQETDDFVEVLLGLGAPVNIETKDSLRPYSRDKQTLLDWVRAKVKELSKKIDTAEDALKKRNIVESEAAGLVGWKKYLFELRKYQIEAEERYKAEGNSWNQAQRWTNGEQLRLNKDRKAYFEDVERLLVAHGAKTYNELHAGAEAAAAAARAADPLLARFASVQAQLDNFKLSTQIELKPLECRYVYLSKEQFGMSRFTPEHLKSAYDELFEACYAGDNETIQRLCLPSMQSGKETGMLLDISVMVKASHESDYERSGLTPFFAAVVARRWSTAKLIIAIATAQYQSDDAEELKQLRKFEVDNWINSDSESDCEDECVGTEELEAERRREIKFVDIAKRKSEVKSDVHPQVMLQCQSAYYIKKDGKYSTGKSDLLWKAVEESDMQTFVQVANLFESLAVPLSLDSGGLLNRYSRLINVVLTSDNAEFLDEYIRRTGYGFDFKSETKDGEEGDAPIVVNDRDRVYLGLNVHGKKRSDLAMKNDPNATENVDDFVKPLLWQAIERNATAVVKYLSSDRPFAAYQFYALSHRGEQCAERLLRIPDLQKAVPELVGWKMNSLGESPLTAAVLGGKVETMKMLFAISPALMKQALHQNIKFVGYNPVLLAVAAGRDADVVDYLRSKSISPAERDLVKGWNIYHFLCSVNNHGLLDHLLTKLPRDVTEALLVQQSKHCLNTPLLVAIKSGALRCVKLLLPYTEVSLTMRDAAGSLPLHAAVRHGYAEIAQLLISAGPSKALFTENAVGNTALEIASLVYLNKRVADASTTHTHRYGAMRLGVYSSNDGALRYKVTQLEKSLPALKMTIDKLEEEGKVQRDDKLLIAMRKFVSKMEERLVEAMKAEDAAISSNPQQPKASITDSQDVKKTFEVVSQAVGAISGNSREVVHLLDVQLSVSTALEREKLKSEEETDDYGGRSRGYSRRKVTSKKMEKEVLAEEVADEKKERGKSLVFARVKGAMRTDELFD